VSRVILLDAGPPGVVTNPATSATLWARARQQGVPTADPKELDCDVILAAQVLTCGASPADAVVATSNVGHLGRFVPAHLWAAIAP
jgi:hypothetical protein